MLFQIDESFGDLKNLDKIPRWNGAIMVVEQWSSG